MSSSRTRAHFPNPHPWVGVVGGLTIENDGEPRPATLLQVRARASRVGPILRARILDEGNGQIRSYELAAHIIRIHQQDVEIYSQWWSVSWHTKVGGQTILTWKRFVFPKEQV